MAFWADPLSPYSIESFCPQSPTLPLGSPFRLTHAVIVNASRPLRNASPVSMNALEPLKF